MPSKLSKAQRRELLGIIKAGKAGRKTHKYYRARALLAFDSGLPAERVVALLGHGVFAKAGPGKDEESSSVAKPEPTFEEDLQYVLDKNAELYRRLAR